MNSPAINQDIDRIPKKNWPKGKNGLAEGQSPLQEVEVNQLSRLYLLVCNIIHDIFRMVALCLYVMLTVPPLDSGAVWTEDYWSKSIYINSKKK